MSDVNAVPPGWYPDPNVPGQQRWWDGIQWTDHVQAPYSAAQPFSMQVAPAGTKTGTVWIWLIALMPLLGIISLFTIDITGYIDDMMRNPGSTSGMLQLYTSPAYLLTIALGWLSIAASVLFAYLDWRALKARGVPAPFHWAFGFLAIAGFGLVYPIGRSVVVRRRTGGGLAPLWVAIAVYVVIFIVVIAWTIALMNQIFTMMPSTLS